MIKEHSAIKLLKRVKKRYSSIIDKMLETRTRTRTRSNSDRESWQFLSESEMMQILSKTTSKQNDTTYQDMIIATWGITKGIYQFDCDAFNAVIDTESNDNIPKDILLQLPEWAIYIESPGLTLYGENIKGFFASVVGDEFPELLFIVGNFGNSCDVCILSLEKETIGEMLFAVTQIRSDAKPIHDLTCELNKLISLLIFISTQRSEINGSPANPIAKKTKLGYRVDVNNDNVVWNVGERIGAAIRLSEKQRRDYQIVNDVTRNSARPHIRRAHWHGYWYGKGRVDYKLNWVAPSLINVDDSLPAVIHKIKK